MRTKNSFLKGEIFHNMTYNQCSASDPILTIPYSAKYKRQRENKQIQRGACIHV